MTKRFSLLFDDEEEGIFNPFTPPSSQPAPQPENNPAPSGDSPPPPAQDPPGDSQRPPVQHPPADQNPASPPENTPSPAQQPSQEPTELLICAGAKCRCDKAASPAPVELKVVSQRKYFINDADGSRKLMATTAENNVLALNFKNCSVPNNSTPCQPKLEWKDFYAGVEAGGVKVLTEKSTALCTAKGGKITFQTHGQQMAITTRQLQQADASNWTATNPFLAEADLDILESDADGENTPGAGIVRIAPVTASAAPGLARTYPPGTTVEFKVKEYSKRADGRPPTAAQKAAIDWVVYDGNLQPILLKSDIGPLMHARFSKPGDYIIEAYGKNPSASNSHDRQSRAAAATCRISIRANGLSGVRVSGSQRVRVQEAVHFTASLLFGASGPPLAGQPLSATTWEVGHCLANGAIPAGTRVALLDGVGQRRKGAELRHSFAQEGRYVVIASLNGEQKQSTVIEVVKNRVASVATSAASARVGDTLTFSAHYLLDPPLAEEQGRLKWHCQDAAGQPLADFGGGGQVRHPYRFTQEGHYTVYAYLNARSEQVKTQVEVLRPTLTHACWKGTGDGGQKTITGWAESSKLSLAFKACQGLKVELRVYGHTRQGVVELDRLAEKTIPESNYLEHTFVLSQGLASKLKAGDRLSFRVVVKTPGYSIGGAMQEKNYLKLVEEEKILKLGFYLNGKAVMGVNYGDELQCRVQARNLVGQSVKVQIYRVERRRGQDWLRQDTSLVEQDCPIGESGWGAFSFRLPEGENSSYGEAVHYFRAYVVDQSWFGADSLSVGQAGSGSELPAVNNTSVLLFARKDSKKGQHQPQFVGIQQNGDRQKTEECPRCKAKLTKADLTKMFPDLKADKDLFSKTRDRYKSKFNITLPDYTLDAFVSELNKTMEEFQINTCRRKAAFLAQLAQETGNFIYAVEHISETLANSKYANKNGNEKIGDGFKFRGRGLIQITGRGNYKRFGEFAVQDYLQDPDAMLQSLACLVRSAGWFWQHGQTLKSKYVDINTLADVGNFRLISKLIQGGEDSVIERRAKLATINPVIFEDGRCKAEKSSTQPGVEIHIYQEGKIEKIVPKADTETYLVRYYYHDKEGGKHYLGISDFHKTPWRASSSTEQKKDKDGNTFDYSELIDFHSLISYSSEKVKFRFIPGSLGKENRFYVDIDAFACLLGAMIEESIEDLAFNGFSKVDGDTGHPSVSHKNGMIGDFRYLNKSKDGSRTYVSIDKTNQLMNPNLDYDRQVKFNNALYKFGYSQYHNGTKLVEMLSNTFIKDGISTELPHIAPDPDHFDHLHVQGLKLSAVFTIKSK